ncbi:hypothetical protein WME89_05685 [Sorangium sp. So ce321]|uniref:hypothetical protein n=1 Tax=Sorangium sp. So ce321 TaxID=3133300 RepID=UPI003F5D8E99
MFKQAFVSVALLTLSACGDAEIEEDPGDSSRGLSAASCSILFNDRFQITGAGWSARLTGGILIGLSTNTILSLDTEDGFFEDCGRSDVKGAYVTSYFPRTDDYTMTLTLESASCGNRTVVISGDCNSDGVTGTASWNGKPASVAKIVR